jgi:hypothetical protein
MSPNPNASALAKATTAAVGHVEAYLLEYGVEEEADRLWTFWLNPSTLRFSGDTKYSPANQFAAREEDFQFGYSTGLTLSIPDLLFEGYWIRKSIRPILEAIDELRKANIKQNKFAPPILSFVWGGRKFSPCVLTSVQWDETAWLTGEPARATMSLSFQQIPEPGKLGLGNIAPELETANDSLPGNKLRNPLTNRQKDDGIAKAAAYLTDNVQRYDDATQAVIKSADLKTLLSVTDSTGLVTLKDSKGKDLGVAGQWNGTEFKVESIETLPLFKNQEQPTRDYAKESSPTVPNDYFDID